MRLYIAMHVMTGLVERKSSSWREKEEALVKMIYFEPWKELNITNITSDSKTIYCVSSLLHCFVIL